LFYALIGDSAAGIHSFAPLNGRGTYGQSRKASTENEERFCLTIGIKAREIEQAKGRGFLKFRENHAGTQP